MKDKELPELQLGLSDLKLNNMPAKNLTVAVTGSGGLIGKKLCKELQSRGHKVIKLIRPESNAENPTEQFFQTRIWNPYKPDKDILNGVDVLVHLAGKSIAGRFNKKHIKQIRESRITPTENLAKIASETLKVKAFICAGAIAYYGYKTPKPMNENDKKGKGTLSDICQEWEKACEEIKKAGKRLVNIRTAIVLDSDGKFLKTQIILTKLYLNATLGGGKNYFAWISAKDIINIYINSIENENYEGIINGVAPQNITNGEFAKAISKILRKPLLFNIPAFVLKIILGKTGAKELALADQKITPRYLLDKEYKYTHPTIEQALEYELNRSHIKK